MGANLSRKEGLWVHLCVKKRKITFLPIRVGLFPLLKDSESTGRKAHTRHNDGYAVPLVGWLSQREGGRGMTLFLPICYPLLKNTSQRQFNAHIRVFKRVTFREEVVFVRLVVKHNRFEGRQYHPARLLAEGEIRFGLVNQLLQILGWRKYFDGCEWKVRAVNHVVAYVNFKPGVDGNVRNGRFSGGLDAYLRENGEALAELNFQLDDQVFLHKSVDGTGQGFSAFGFVG